MYYSFNNKFFLFEIVKDEASDDASCGSAAPRSITRQMVARSRVPESVSLKLKCSNAHPFHALYASYCTHCEHTTNIHHSPDTKLFFLWLVSLERRQHMLSLFGGYPTTTYCTNGYWVSMIQCIIKYVLMTQIIQLFANMLYTLYKTSTIYFCVQHRSSN